MNPFDLPASLVATHPDPVPEAAHARVLMDQAQTGLYVVQDGLIGYANPMLAAMLGWPAHELVGQPHTVTMSPEFHAHADAAVARRLAGHAGHPGEVRCTRRDGTLFDVRVLARCIEFHGRPAVLVTLLDITELKEALRSAEWNASMLARTEALCRAGSFEMAWPAGRLRMSAGLVALLGLPPGSPLDANLETLSWVPDDEQAYVAGIWRNAVAGEAFEFQHRVLCADGRRLVVLHRGQLDDGGRGVALLQDVSAQVEAAERIQDLATHHEVTGLPNRAWLLDQVDAAMHAARWESRGFALLAIDLPRIAEVKASMGFGAGDTLCMALAARLRQQVGTEVLIAHLGDTEFAVMLEVPAVCDSPSGDTPPDASTGSPRDQIIDALRDRATALQLSLQLPVRLGSTDVYAQCLVGVAAFPGDGESADRLLECAQTARLDVEGGQGVAFFRPESTVRAIRAMNIESALWQALERDEFVLHYQPQVDLCSGAICGAEALLRWRSPDLGEVSPGEFIPVAERSGLIGAIGEWVLRQACQQLGAWRRAGLPAVRVGVNLAASQLQQPDLADRVQALLLETGADPACLGVELTESMVMADVEGASAVLRAIKNVGVQISLDDFGTGFSSLSCLSQLPIDVVKVDRSFVRDVTADAQDVSVTRAIIQMTHGLQMRALAEGVETEGQLALLVAAGCDEVQGYWFSKAVPADDFAAMLDAGKRLPERYVRSPGGRRERTLLLVDDEDNILASLKRLLRRDGYRIVTALSAAEGLQRLAEEEIDVIVTDQRMPGMTGVEFLHRAKDLYPNTLRLVLSGYTELQSIIDAINEGAIYKFLTKPWDDERLRGHVAEAFKQKELADENRRLARQVDSANADLASLNERLEGLLGQQREQADLLAASAGRMRDVFDDLPIAMLGLDADGTLSFVNRKAERLLPALGALLGGPACDLLPAELLAAPVDSGEPQRRRARLQGRDFDVLTRLLPSDSAARGRLLMLLPAVPPEKP